METKVQRIVNQNDWGVFFISLQSLDYSIEIHFFVWYQLLANDF